MPWINTKAGKMYVEKLPGDWKETAGALKEHAKELDEIIDFLHRHGS